MTKPTAKRKVFVIGLVGGIAAGKSHVARQFQLRGAPLIEADKLAHEILRRPLNARQLGQIFGTEILAADGSIIREELANRVFGDDAESAKRLAQLEQVVHPQIHAEAVKALRRFKESDSPPNAVVIDAPLLLEAGWAPLCDLILYVDSPFELRKQRAMQRGWTTQQFERREAAQMPLDDKRRSATHIINGAADDQELGLVIDRLLAEMRA